MRIGHLLRELRSHLQAQGTPVLTFDIGDVLDRIRPETEATLGQVNAALMAALGYDGWVFGNNEGLTIPLAMWPLLVSRSGSRTFGTNIRSSTSENLPFFHDWAVYDCQGVRVGVFGLTADYDKPYENLGVHVLKPHAQALVAVQALQQEACDVIVLLSHLGLREDRKLADAVAGIDVILGGHTHDFMSGADFVGRTAIFQAGKHALTFGHTTIDYDANERRVHRVYSEPIGLNPHGPYDTQMHAAFQESLPDVTEHLMQRVVDLQEPLVAEYNHESTFANLLVDALFDAYPCDLGVMMAGALTASLLPGEIRMEHVHAACLTPTRPLLITMHGKDIRSFLEKAVTSRFKETLGYGYGFRGSVIGHMALANAQVVVSREGRDGQGPLESVIINGSPLIEEQTYRLVSCEYLWLSPLFEEFQRGCHVDIQPCLVRDVLLEKMKEPRLRSRASQPRYLLPRS